MTRLSFSMAAALLTLGLTGCGVGFEVGKDDRKNEERVIITAPVAPLTVLDSYGDRDTNGLLAEDAAGVIATFNYDSTGDHHLRLRLNKMIRERCPDPDKIAPKFTWRELDGAGATLSESEVELESNIPVKKDAHYNLVVDLTARVGKCLRLGAFFYAYRHAN